jgi:hypothetical protein
VGHDLHHKPCEHPPPATAAPLRLYEELVAFQAQAAAAAAATMASAGGRRRRPTKASQAAQAAVQRKVSLCDLLACYCQYPGCCCLCCHSIFLPRKLLGGARREAELFSMHPSSTEKNKLKSSHCTSA